MKVTPMNPEYEQRLEKLIDRKLKMLGERPAPGTLMPRVLAAIAAQKALPWYKRSFQRWPKSAQILFLITAAVAYVGVIYGISVADSAVNLTEAAKSTAVAENAGAALSFFEALFRAGKLLANQLTLPWIAAIAALVMFMSASVVGAGAAIVRLALPQIRFNNLQS
ncbi:MAG TPA: hypothetical protein VEH27_15690 [Methylomirabilota bacterium]|nr:hypothetical protein [Methylomirabilota bacterium]